MEHKIFILKISPLFRKWKMIKKYPIYLQLNKLKSAISKIYLKIQLLILLQSLMRNKETQKKSPTFYLMKLQKLLYISGGLFIKISL